MRTGLALTAVIALSGLVSLVCTSQENIAEEIADIEAWTTSIVADEAVRIQGTRHAAAEATADEASHQTDAAWATYQAADDASTAALAHRKNRTAEAAIKTAETTAATERQIAFKAYATHIAYGEEHTQQTVAAKTKATATAAAEATRRAVLDTQ